MSLDRKLARWESAGLIDGDTRARIRALEQSERAPIALYALGVLGAATLALGILSVIAANWDGIPGTVKLAVDLLIGLGLAVATYVAVRRDAGWPAEVLITVFYGFTLASIAVVGQASPLTAPAYQALLVWTAATLPLVLLGRSQALAALAVAGLATTHALSVSPLIEFLNPGGGANRDLSATILFASPLLYLPLARIPWLLRNRPVFSRTLTVAAWIAALVLGFALQFIWYDHVERYQVLRWSLGTTGAVAAATVLALPRLYPNMALRARYGLSATVVFAWLTLLAGAAVPRSS